MKRTKWYALFLFLLLLFTGIWTPHLLYLSQSSRLTDETVRSAGFRSQPLGETEIEALKESGDPGKTAGIYWLETDFGQQTGAAGIKNETSLKEAADREERWAARDGWTEYIAWCRAIWNDLKYFPVAASPGHPKLTVTFEDSWLYGRSYGGERGHEGTDIMAAVNERGVYPVVSMTDGVVANKGWLELGGYRVGIRTDAGAYFYYAHLDSYAEIEEGDQIKAGDLLGYMGDTGYSKVEGTTGNFPVHLHIGIYIYPDGEEISVNPYPALKYIEEEKIRFAA